MIKKEKVIIETYNVLEEKDVEEIVSNFLGREVKVADMGISLVDRVPYGRASQSYMICDVYVDGKELVDAEYEGILWKFMPNKAHVEVEYIFDFDVSKFKSFERYTDESD